MTEDKNGMYSRRTIDDILDDIMKRVLMAEDEENSGVSENYRILHTLGFVMGLYRAAYDNLNLVERMVIPFSQFVKAEDVVKYGVLLNEVLNKLEELSDLLDSFDDAIAKTLDVWGKEEEE